RTRLPRVVFFGHSGPEGHDVSLDSVVGQGDLLAFGSASYAARGSRGRYAVWRVDGVDSIAVRARPGTGDLVAAGGGLLATQLRDRRIALLRTDGRVVRVIAPSRGRATETLDGFEP